MGARPERGAFGNARGKPDIQKRRRINRENDPRYQQAMADVHKHNDMIDQLAQQSIEDAERTARARSEIGLVYEKPEVAVPEPTVEPVAPRRGGVAMGRFVDCHCGHSHDNHTGRMAPQCSFDPCSCVGYRPNTAPDPLSPTAVKVSGIDVILKSAKESDKKRTVELAEKIEGLLVELKTRVDMEDEEREAKARELARTREARERLERAERELREARKALQAVAPKRKPQTRKSPTVPKSPHYCPEINCERHTRPFDTPQGLGAHRAHAHGYRRVKS